MKTLSITGFLGHDPRLRQLPNGDPVLNCSVGVSDRRKGRDGQWENATLWIDCTLFGQRAKWLADNLRKGMRVGASGELTLRQYDARDGTPKQQLEIIARDIEPLEKLEVSSARSGGTGSYGAGRGSQREEQQSQFDDADDIPF